LGFEGERGVGGFGRYAVWKLVMGLGFEFLGLIWVFKILDFGFSKRLRVVKKWEVWYGCDQRWIRAQFYM